jgi:DNA-binding response OmpR family regulator
MKLLIAEDDAFFSNVLQKTLAPHHELVVANDGNAAWIALQAANAPRLAILDWVMPGLSGPEICRKVRSSPALSSMYLIIVTARNSSADIVSGLRAGADDYITKPFVPEELRVRIQLGERILASQSPFDSQWHRYPQAAEQEDHLAQNLIHSPFRRRPPSGADAQSGLIEPFNSNRDSVAHAESDRPAVHAHRFLEKLHA